MQLDFCFYIVTVERLVLVFVYIFDNKPDTYILKVFNQKLAASAANNARWNDDITDSKTSQQQEKCS